MMVKLLQNKMILGIVASAMLLFSCQFKSNTPDVSGISAEVNIQRFEKDLFALKTKAELDSFKVKYKDFFPLYSSKVIGLGDPDVPNYMGYLNKFLNDSTMNLVADRVEEVFPDLRRVEEELESAFKYFRYYFPSKKIPGLYSQIAGFNQSIVVGPKSIGISLDKYLGKDCEFYSYLGTPMYARKNMIPERIAQDVVLAYGLTEFPFEPLTDDLVSNMIYQGKVRYFLQQLMPEKPEADVMKYTPEELAWCKKNKELMWGFIIEQKHLFSTEYRTIIKYINDGPFTPGMPREAPARTGIWLGWQIVKAYMDKQKEDYTLGKLMQENDYAMILRESAFQP